MDRPIRPNSNSAEFRTSVVLKHSCYVVLGLNGHRIPPLSQVVWSSNCLVEGGSTPLGLEDGNPEKWDVPSLDLRIQGLHNLTKRSETKDSVRYKGEPLQAYRIIVDMIFSFYTLLLDT